MCKEKRKKDREKQKEAKGQTEVGNHIYSRVGCDRIPGHLNGKILPPPQELQVTLPLLKFTGSSKNSLCQLLIAVSFSHVEL